MKNGKDWGQLRDKVKEQIKEIVEYNRRRKEFKKCNKRIIELLEMMIEIIEKSGKIIPEEIENKMAESISLRDEERVNELIKELFEWIEGNITKEETREFKITRKIEEQCGMKFSEEQIKLFIEVVGKENVSNYELLKEYEEWKRLGTIKG